MLSRYNADFTLKTYTHTTRAVQEEAQTTGSLMAQVM